GPTGRRPPPLAAPRARRTAAARRGSDLRTAHPGRPPRPGGTGTDALRNGHGGGGGHGGRGGHGGGGGHGGATGTSVGAGTADAEAGPDRGRRAAHDPSVPPPGLSAGPDGPVSAVRRGGRSRARGRRSGPGPARRSPRPSTR